MSHSIAYTTSMTWGEHLHERIICLNCKCKFKRLANCGYIDLDEEMHVSDGKKDVEYLCWIHEAWHDFINQMSGTNDRPIIRLEKDMCAHCTARLKGIYNGEDVTAKTHLTFRYIPLEHLKSTYHWKVSLYPTTFRSKQRSS